MEELTIRLTGAASEMKLPPVTYNKTEIEQTLNAMLADYTGRVYTPDDIKGAKADRATVNHIEKDLAACQKRVKDLYNAPIAQFDAEMKGFRAKIKQVSAAIDMQVKAVESAEKEEKKKQIASLFDGVLFENCAGDELRELIKLDSLFKPEWLNKTYKMEDIKAELKGKINVIGEEISLIRANCGADTEACMTVYLSTAYDVRKALQEHNRLEELRRRQAAAEKARKEAEAARAAAPMIEVPTEEQREAQMIAQVQANMNTHLDRDTNTIRDDSPLDKPKEPECKWYNFGAWLTREDIDWLKAGFAERHIRYGKAKL